MKVTYSTAADGVVHAVIESDVADTSKMTQMEQLVAEHAGMEPIKVHKKAVCSPEDQYDEQVGKQVARDKALIAFHLKRRKQMFRMAEMMNRLQMKYMRMADHSEEQVIRARKRLHKHKQK